MIKSKIEWCDTTFNPVSGCNNNCDYCYARRIANRFKGCDASPEGHTEQTIVELDEPLIISSENGEKLRNAAYPFGFTPTFHRYRLNQFKRMKFGKTIFVCSMGDLFAPWIPDEWIEAVFHACQDNPEHRYLFLTKYPERYLELGVEGRLPQEKNFWYGSTVVRPEVQFFRSEAHNTFLSIEPLIEPFGPPEEGCGIADTDWIILGAMTGPGSEEHQPSRSWIEDIVASARLYGKPVFMKNSLIPVWGESLITEFPWDNAE